MIFGTKEIFLILNPKNPRNIILTGLPRSGTTLACKILCDFDQVIALNEPLDPINFDSQERAVSNIKGKFEEFRNSLLNEGRAPARTQDGKITDNAFSPEKSGERRRQVQRTMLDFEKKLKPNFSLVLKHCAGFSLLLPKLQREFECYAIVRNPLAVLASWNSVSVPVSRGRVAKAEKLSPNFHQELTAIKDLREKQLFILDWYFSQFDLLSHERVVKYEEIIASGGACLSMICDSSDVESQTLENRNSSYEADSMQQLGELLLNSEGSYWKYYSKEDVQMLFQ